MKAFVALMLVGLVGQGMASALLPLDTPEVAAAKAAHFARYNYEAARNSLGAAPYLAGQAYYQPLIYSAPIAYPSGYYASGAPIGLDGRVVDTPEVAAAKAEHFAAHARASLKPYGALAASSYYAYGYPYTAPIGPDGRVVDTPEVAQAKAAHFAAHAAAQH